MTLYISKEGLPKPEAACLDGRPFYRESKLYQLGQGSLCWRLVLQTAVKYSSAASSTICRPASLAVSHSQISVVT